MIGAKTSGVGETAHGSGASDTIDLKVIALALSLAVAAGVHGTLLPSHARESAWLGLGFAAAGAFQLAAAVLLLMRPSPRLLSLVAAGSAVVLAAWVVSRTVGLPGPPNEWTPEPVGPVDGLTSLFEAGAIGLALALARRDPSRLHEPRRTGSADVAAVWLVGSVGVFLLAVASAHESHGQGADDHLAGHVAHAAILGVLVALLPLVRLVHARLGRDHAC